MTSVRSAFAAAVAIGLFVRGFLPTAVGAGLEVRSLMPAGGARASTVEVVATGNFPRWPVQAWVDRPGLSVSASGDKGKLAVTIAADTAAGTYWIRLYDAAGAAAPRPFVVGTLAEANEQEPNNSPAKAQAVTAPVVVNGRLGASGDVDMFAVPLSRGQTLVASIAGNETLGSPMDSVLEIVSPRGNVLAYNHDRLGLDPQIEFTAPADGVYLARVFAFPSVPNSTIAFAGGDQYVYRLSLTTGAVVDYPWPLAATRGRETQVELCGWNITDALRTVSIKPEGPMAEIFDPQMARGVSLIVEPHNTLIEIEPNPLGAAQKVELPVTVTGRIENSGDVDAFSFEAKQGEPLAFQVESRALGYPLDAVLEVTDSTGKSLARVDDVAASRDAALVFSPPTDGMFRVAVSDLNRQGSSRHVYRLRAVKAVGDFEVTADADSYVLASDKPTDITLSVARLNGLAENIEFTVSGLPEGVTAAPAQSSAQGESAKTVKLTLSASGGAHSGPIRIIGRAAGPGQIEHAAGAALPLRGMRTSDLWLTVTGTKQ